MTAGEMGQVTPKLPPISVVRHTGLKTSHARVSDFQLFFTRDLTVSQAKSYRPPRLLV